MLSMTFSCIILSFIELLCPEHCLLIITRGKFGGQRVTIFLELRNKGKSDAIFWNLGKVVMFSAIKSNIKTSLFENEILLFTEDTNSIRN